MSGYVATMQLLCAVPQRADTGRVEIGSIDANSMTTLHHASRKGEFNTAQLLLDKGADVNAIDIKNQSPLHHASNSGHLEIVRLLLDSGANIEAIDCMELSAIHIAAAAGHRLIVRAILERGASVHAADQNGRTPLHLAAMEGHTSVIKVLSEFSSFGIETQDYGHYTPLHYAIIRKKYSAVAALVNLGANIFKTLEPSLYTGKIHRMFSMALVSEYFAFEDGVDEVGGITPLHIAAATGDIAIVELLIRKRADIEAVLTWPNTQRLLEFTPLHVAIIYHHPAVAHCLVSKGANIHTKTRIGDTALHVACKCHNFESSELLIQYGADLSTKNFFGSGLMHDLIRAGNKYRSQELLSLLLTKGAPIHAVDYRGKTALFYAVAIGELTLIETLLSNGAEANVSDRFGKSLMHYAAESKTGDRIAQILLLYGADLDMRNEEEETLLHSAVYCRNYGMAEFLLSKGANIHAVNLRGETPLDRANDAERIDIRELLKRHLRKTE